MLKITELHNDAPRARLKLDGRIVSEWVDLLKEECERHAIGGTVVLLDCSGVTYVDRHGVKVVTQLERNGLVELEDCPDFVRQLLTQGDET